MIRDLTYVGEGLIPAPLDGPALRYTPLPKGAVTDIAVHHWTGRLPPETELADEEIAYIIRIDQFHRTDRGLDGIGYQVCQFPSGRVYITSRLDRYGAGVGGENNHVISIGLPGDFNSNPPSPGHLAATVEAVRYVYDYLGRDVPTQPHRFWGGTTCPGDHWPEWVPQLREQALEEEDDMALTQEDKDWMIILRNDGVKMVEKAIVDHFEKVEKPYLREVRKGGLEHIDHWANARMRNILEAIKAAGGGGASADAIIDRMIERWQD